ncbi:MAG: ABC transporter permease [Candidatus Ranarchaeia archaeon]
MRIRDVFAFSFGAVRKRKLRAGLTTLGVVIGIASIVALLALGQGFENEINRQFQTNFSTDTLIVSSGSFGFQGSDFELYANDSRYVAAIDNVTRAVAVLQKGVTLRIGSKEVTTTVVGVNYSEYAAIYSNTFKASQGEIPSTSDNNSIVIGWKLHDPYSNGSLLLEVGDSITLVHTYRNGTQFLNKTYDGSVTGILGEIGGFSVGGPTDLSVYMPIDEAIRFFDDDVVAQIVVQVVDDKEETLDSVAGAIRDLFNDEVSVTEPASLLSSIGQILSIVELFLAGIAGISLLVAGIGIMNIMIVSLMERTREIGILKALGMKNGSVLLVFLSEAVIIGLIGGCVGVTLGYILSLVAGQVLGNFMSSGGSIDGGFGSPRGPSATFSITPVVSPNLAFMAIGFGLFVSIIFALYPAWRASKLEPVDALRYE